jgi:heat-inducible transcriptional repressor
LYRITEIFNSNFKGSEIEKIKKTILDEIYTDLFKEKMTVKTIFELLEDFTKQNDDEKIFLGGTLNILEQPEFSNVDKIKTILGILEEKEVLKKLMQRDEAADGLIIKIGGENKYKEVHECSLITATYHIDGKVVGSIGILGPTRMKYSKTVAAVEYITELLSNILSNKV